jgi:murein DD-endopeptidase MepM/ murein hydrolase activator NlpD
VRRATLLWLLPLVVAGWVGLSWLRAWLSDWPHVPTRGLMLHAFGVPVNYQACGFHTGQDWFAPEGTPVYAIEAGTVVYVGPLWSRGEGVGRGESAIVLQHGGYYTTYSHNRVALVTPGQAVAKGEVIAEIGDEGYARSPHLHLEKVTAPFTGNWQEPFVGCGAYQDPGDRWSPF